MVVLRERGKPDPAHLRRRAAEVPTAAGSMTRTSRPGAAVTFALAVGAAGGWPATQLLAAPPPLAAGPRYLIATVAEGTVERQIGLDAKAVWSGGTSVLGARPGTVAGVRISG